LGEELNSYQEVIKKIGLTTLRKEELAVLCGAGISVNSGIPSAFITKGNMLKRTRIKPEDLVFLTGFDISFEMFMQYVNENIAISPLLSIYKNGSPNTNHNLLAYLARDGIVKTIVTTNFDQLIERAFDNLGIKYNLFYKEDDFTNIDYDCDQVNIIKIHGCASDPNSIRTTMMSIADGVLSEKRRAVMESLFRTGKHKSVLVAGYSCSDTDIVPQIQRFAESEKKVIYLKHQQSTNPSLYSIPDRFADLDPAIGIDVKKVLKCFEGLDLSIITGDVDLFVEELCKLNNYPIDIIDPNSLVALGKKIDEVYDVWINDSFELGLDYLCVGRVIQGISNYPKSIIYINKTLAIIDKIVDEQQQCPLVTSGFPFDDKGRPVEKIQVLKAICHSMLGVSYDSNFEHQKAIDHFSMAIEIHKKNRNKMGVSSCHNSIGVALCGMKEFQKAIKSLTKAVQLKKELRDELGESNCYLNFANVYEGLNNFEKAMRYIEKSIKLKRRIGDLPGLCRCFNTLGNIYSRQSDYKNAVVNYKEANSISLKVTDVGMFIASCLSLCWCCIEVGNIEFISGNYPESKEYFIEALEGNITNFMQDKNEMIHCTQCIGTAYLLLGLERSAGPWFESADKLADEKGLPRLIHPMNSFGSCRSSLMRSM
jgi:tetratricopeptide (TPR) repeat protein